MVDVLDRIDKNARAFSRTLMDLTEAIDADYEKVVRLAVLKVFKSIVKRSPVDTGAYRASHGITSGESPKGDQGVVSSEEAGGMSWNVSSAFLEAEARGWRWKMGDGMIYIFNNQPYAQRLEEGHSGQAPRGVYSLAIAEFDRAVREEVRKVKSLVSR